MRNNFSTKDPLGAEIISESSGWEEGWVTNVMSELKFLSNAHSFLKSMLKIKSPLINNVLELSWSCISHKQPHSPSGNSSSKIINLWKLKVLFLMKSLNNSFLKQVDNITFLKPYLSNSLSALSNVEMPHIGKSGFGISPEIFF